MSIKVIPGSEHDPETGRTKVTLHIIPRVSEAYFESWIYEPWVGWRHKGDYPGWWKRRVLNRARRKLLG